MLRLAAVSGKAYKGVPDFLIDLALQLQNMLSVANVSLMWSQNDQAVVVSASTWCGLE